MSKYYQTKQFNALNEKWNKKLAKSGFKDLETEKGLTDYVSRERMNYPDYIIDMQRSYYQLCEMFLDNFEFKNKYDKIIWSYYCEGLSDRAIMRLVNQVRRKKVSHVTIWRAVKRLEAIMKQMYLTDTNEDQGEH